MIKTYADVIRLLETSKTSISAPIFFLNGTYEWLPIDRTAWLAQLKEVSNPEQWTYPCHIEIERDGEMFLHPRVEP